MSQNERGRRDNDVVYVSSSPQTDTTDRSGDDATIEATRADIANTRAEMNQTISAIGEKLNPPEVIQQVRENVTSAATELMEQAKDKAKEAVDKAKDVGTQVVEQAKESVSQVVDQTKDAANESVDKAAHSVSDATIGRVEHMADNLSETGSNIIETVKKNPIPFALAGVGLLFLLRGNQNKSNKMAGQNMMPQYYPYPMPPQMMGQGYNPAMYQPDQTADGSSGMMGGVMNTVRQHPVTTAAAGVGLGWLATRGQDNSNQSNGDTSLIEQAKDKVGEVTDKIGQKAGEITDKVGQKAGEVTGKVGEMPGKVGDSAGNIGNTVQQQVQRTGSSLENMMQDNPMILGAGALLLGMAVGLMLPETEPENQLLSSARDNLLDKAQEVTHQTFEKVQHVAQEATETVKQEAKNQGLTAS